MLKQKSEGDNIIMRLSICVGNQTIIGSDKGLSPGWRQAIIWTNAGILLVGHLRRNFSEILIEIHKFSFRKMYLNMSSAKWRPFCLCLNVLKQPFNIVSVKINLKEVSTSSHVPRVVVLLVAIWNPGKTIWCSNWWMFNSIYPVESFYSSEHGWWLNQ